MARTASPVSYHQGAVRTLGVVDLEEAGELALLRAQVVRRRLCRRVLERLVHALVAAILGRLAGLDPDGVNAQADPPHGKSRQTTEALAGEGHAIVAEDLQRQPVPAEPVGEGSLDPYVLGGFQAMAAEQVTA